MTQTLQEQARLLCETIRLMKRRFPEPEMLMRDNRDSSGADFPDLTIPQLNMLSTCHDIGPATIKEIAADLEVSAPSVSAMVDRLVEMGVLTREQSPRDRRQVVVRLTDLGTRVVLRMDEYMVDAFTEVLERIGPHYAEMWCEVYREINRVYGNNAGKTAEMREGVAS
jgi:DNA-binding MarR family transcriptional regulator